MSLGAKKGLRYLLPLFPVFDVLAAIGWERWQQGIAKLLKCPRLARWFVWVPVTILVIIALPLHPYYGLHYNWLWGGIQSAKAVFSLQEQAEGVDVAARWLHAYDEDNLRVAVQQPGMLVQYTDAQVVEFDDPQVDYFVLDRNHIVRNYRPFEWGKVWMLYRSREPAFRVSFCGIPYVWVYEALPRYFDVHTPDHAFGGQLGDNIEMLGYDWHEANVSPGEPLPLHLYWRALRPTAGDYIVFVHLMGPDGRLFAQCDSEPVGGDRPTSTWKPDEIIRDECPVVLPSDAPRGEYQMFVGMYSWPDLERLPAYALNDKKAVDKRLSLVTFNLSSSASLWRYIAPSWGVSLTLLAVGTIGSRQKEKNLSPKVQGGRS